MSIPLIQAIGDGACGGSAIQDGMSAPTAWPSCMSGVIAPPGFAAAVSALLFFYAVAYAFPNARRIALQQEREVVEQENRAFCETHGMLSGTREHTVCAEDLMDIRANERQRTLD